MTPGGSGRPGASRVVLVGVKKAKTARHSATIIKHPAASPSSPSVKFTAFEVPVMTNKIRTKEKAIAMFLNTGSLKKGRYK